MLALIRRFGLALAAVACLAAAARAGTPSEKPWKNDLKAVPVNGTMLPVLSVGEGPAIVLLHGSGEDWRTWLGVIQPLSRKHRVIAYSRRHYYPGTGGAAKRDMTPEVNDKDLLGVLQALGVTSAHLVGHGTGGALAATFAVDHPERVASLTLIEPELPMLLVGTQAESAYVNDRRLMIAQTRMAVQDGFADLALAHVLEWNVGATALESVPRWVQGRMADDGEALRLEMASAVAPKLGPERVAKLKCPTLVLDGAKSPDFARATTDAMLKARPVTEHVTLKGSGYAAPWTDAKAFDKALLEFMARHEPGTGPKTLAGD